MHLQVSGGSEPEPAPRWPVDFGLGQLSRWAGHVSGPESGSRTKDSTQGWPGSWATASPPRRWTLSAHLLVLGGLPTSNVIAEPQCSTPSSLPGGGQAARVCFTPPPPSIPEHGVYPLERAAFLPVPWGKGPQGSVDAPIPPISHSGQSRAIPLFSKGHAQACSPLPGSILLPLL